MDPRDFNRDENDSRPLSASSDGPERRAYKFSQDEMRVIKECNRESFFQRCIPLGTALGVTAYYGVHAGYLRASPRFGATPKVIVAVVLGYFVGKFSYQTKCAEKLMQLPNSKIGEMLRQRRKGVFKESLEPGFGPGISLAPFSDMNPSNQYTDLNPNNSIDIDTSRPQYDGLDDTHRPSVDNPIYDEEMPPVQHNTTSYEELRRKNREEHQQRKVGNYRTLAEIKEQTPSASQFPTEPTSPEKKTKYGDTWG